MKSRLGLTCFAALVCVAMRGNAWATTIPFGTLSAYNVVALTGNISTASDIGGRAAAAGELTVSTTVGEQLTTQTDPFGSLTTNAVVSSNGMSSGVTLNVNGGGNVYAPGSTAKINFNDGGHLVATGSSGINFSAEATTLGSESAYLGTLTPTGTNLGTGQAGYGNPSFYVLKGASSTVNIFTISASVFADPNHPLDIVTPPGSTTIINVTGGSLQLNTGIYYNGQQYTSDNTATSDILFNFPTATSVAIDGNFSASLLAPLATLSGTGQMGGTLIAASVACTGEIENVEYTGSLPWYSTGVTPEPSSLWLLGSGLLALAGITRMRRNAAAQA